MSTQLTYVDGSNKAVHVSAENPLPTSVTGATPIATDILAGRQSFGATTAATTLITIPAGRTWEGNIGASVATASTSGSGSGGEATARFSILGAGATPTAGIYLGVSTLTGAAMSTSLAGSASSNFGSSPITVSAPVGNSVMVQVASTNAGSASIVDAFAIGKLV